MEVYFKPMLYKFLKTKFLAAFYSILSLVIYYPTVGAGMVFDFNGWTYKYLTGTYFDVLDSFGYPGLHQIEQFAFFSIFKLVHFNQFGWYFIFALLHSFVAISIYKFIYLWLKTSNFKSFQQIALLSSFLFLISPLAADTVVSKVTIHYLLSNLFIISALLLIVKYFIDKSKKHLFLILLLFVLALFSLEISYIFPLLVLFVWISLLYFNEKVIFNIKNILLIFFPFIILFCFLALHKIVIGSMVGHYGSDVHLQFNISKIFSTVIRYFASYIVFFDNWDYQYKEYASIFLEKNAIVILFVLIITYLVTLFYAIKLKKNVLLLLLIVFCLAVVSLAPVANLYYSYMFTIDNDRYSYLSSVFMYLFIVLLFYQINFQKFRVAFIVIFLSFNFNFLLQNIDKLHKSSIITWGLLNDFRWFDKEVIILEEPDNFNGVKMFSTLVETTSFSESLLLHTGIDRREHIKLVYQVNMGTLNDSVIVTKFSPTEYKVELAQWGNWFWKDMIGATSFENEWCKVEIHKEGLNYYNLTLKNVPKNTVLIYAAGKKWTEVK